MCVLLIGEWVVSPFNLILWRNEPDRRRFTSFLFNTDSILILPWSFLFLKTYLYHLTGDLFCVLRGHISLLNQDMKRDNGYLVSIVRDGSRLSICLDWLNRESETSQKDSLFCSLRIIGGWVCTADIIRYFHTPF